MSLKGLIKKFSVRHRKVTNENVDDVFKNDNPIHIEIGMGKGKFIFEHALRDRDINFIGIEKFDSVMVRAIEKLEDVELDNLKLIRTDALKIDEIFDKEIDTIYLNFSDPWPKNRHEDRRLSSEIFLKKYDNVFKSAKSIIMKTDNRKLFEFSLISFVNHGYKIEEISLDLHNDDYKDNIEEEFDDRKLYEVKSKKGKTIVSN